MPKRKAGIFGKSPWITDFLLQNESEEKPQIIHVLGVSIIQIAS